MNSKYYMPTRVIMGDDCIANNSDVFKTLGTKALIVTGAQSAKKNGSEKDVTAALDFAGIGYVIFDKVMSNPTISCVYEGALFAKENKADFVIAIGGGSPMDAGKAIALLAAQDIVEENLFSGSYGDSVLPMVFIPTTAGTGSEVTQYSILTNDKAQTKTSIASDLLFPKIAFLDPKYMEQLSVETTINTAVDALSHAVEGMLSIRSSIITNALAAESIRMISNCFTVMREALNTDSKTKIGPKTREHLLHASFMAGMVIAQTGTTAVHAMGYSLTYFKDIDHGRANGLLLGEYLRLVEKDRPDLTERIFSAMNISCVAEFMELMDGLLCEKETISSEEMKHYSRLAIQTRNIANCIVKPKEEDIIEMFFESFKNKN